MQYKFRHCLLVLVMGLSSLVFGQGAGAGSTNFGGKMNGLGDLNQLGDWYMNSHNAMDRTKNKKDSSGMLNIVFALNDTVVNTAAMILKYGEFIPLQRFHLKIPSKNERYSLIMWYFKPTYLNPNSMVHLTLVREHQGRFNFYVDLNNNQNFTDDGPPFNFTDEQRYNSFEINYLDVTYDLVIVNPNYVEPNAMVLKKERRRQVDRIDSAWRNNFKNISLIVGAKITTGSGYADIRFLNQANELVNYNSRVFGTSRIDANMGVLYHGLQVFGTIGLEYLQMGERHRYLSDPSKNKLEFRPSTGFYPNQKFSFGIGASFDIKIFNLVYVSPLFIYNKIRYENIKKEFDQYSYALNTLSDMHLFNNEAFSYSYGAKFKVAINPGIRLFIDFLQREYIFNAVDYFYDSKPETYQLDYSIFYFGLGLEAKLYTLTF